MLGRTLFTSHMPASLGRAKVAGLSTLLAVFAILTMAGTTFAWGNGSFSPGDEQLLFSLTNRDRASAGLNALVNDSYLHKEAEWRAKDMGDRNYFSHKIPPANNMVFDYMQSDGYCFKVAGENIGLSTYGDDVATTRIETAFMGSPTHRANILGSWVRMGVGAYKAADGRKLYAVLFSIPCGATAPKTPAPATPKPTVRPTPKPTAKPVIAPTATPKSTPNATGTPTLAPTPTPTPTPTSTPTTAPAATPAPTRTPNPTATATPPPTRTPLPVNGNLNLRVRERPTSQGPFNSFLSWLFGGIFG